MHINISVVIVIFWGRHPTSHWGYTPTSRWGGTPTPGWGGYPTSRWSIYPTGKVCLFDDRAIVFTASASASAIVDGGSVGCFKQHT